MSLNEYLSANFSVLNFGVELFLNNMFEILEACCQCVSQSGILWRMIFYVEI